MMKFIHILLVLFLFSSASLFAGSDIWSGNNSNDDIWHGNSVFGSSAFDKPTDNGELPYDESADEIDFREEPVSIGDGTVIMLVFSLLYASRIIVFKRK